MFLPALQSGERSPLHSALSVLEALEDRSCPPLPNSLQDPPGRMDLAVLGIPAIRIFQRGRWVPSDHSVQQVPLGLYDQRALLVLYVR